MRHTLLGSGLAQVATAAVRRLPQPARLLGPSSSAWLPLMRVGSSQAMAAPEDSPAAPRTGPGPSSSESLRQVSASALRGRLSMGRSAVAAF